MNTGKRHSANAPPTNATDFMGNAQFRKAEIYTSSSINNPLRRNTGKQSFQLQNPEALASPRSPVAKAKSKRHRRRKPSRKTAGMLSGSRSLVRGELLPAGLFCTGDCALAFASAAAPLRRHRRSNHNVPDTTISIGEFHGNAHI